MRTRPSVVSNAWKSGACEGLMPVTARSTFTGHEFGIGDTWRVGQRLSVGMRVQYASSNVFCIVVARRGDWPVSSGQGFGKRRLCGPEWTAARVSGKMVVVFCTHKVPDTQFPEQAIRWLGDSSHCVSKMAHAPRQLQLEWNCSRGAVRRERSWRGDSSGR